jgi:pyridoxamine 5'-phosphate oxidase-like protein
MPGYGMLPADQGTGLLPWSWATDRLRESHDYWVASGWPDGRPHVMPVWGVWVQEAFWFSSSPGSRKVRNLRARPECTVTTDDARNPVVLDGVAEIRPDEPDRLLLLESMNAKYEVDYGLDFLDGVHALCLRVQPSSAFGLLEGDFSGSPTRWTC